MPGRHADEQHSHGLESRPEPWTVAVGRARVGPADACALDLVGVVAPSEEEVEHHESVRRGVGIEGARWLGERLLGPTPYRGAARNEDHREQAGEPRAPCPERAHGDHHGRGPLATRSDYLSRLRRPTADD